MKYLEFPRFPEPFRTLSMDEFNALTTDERAAYLRRAVEHLRLTPKPGSEPG